jgi:hypothetical protein
MRITLADCEIMILSTPGEHARTGAVAGLCTRLGLPHTVVDAIECSSPIVGLGCGLSHFKALRRWDGTRPLLLLEDDVAATNVYQPWLDLPDDADAAWLGLSIYGAVKALSYVGFTNLPAAERVNDGLARIYNMLAAHAVLHITPRWRDAACDAIMDCLLERNWPHDCGFARIQTAHRVYAPVAPYFYQAAELQPPEIAAVRQGATLMTLPIISEGEVLQLEVEGNPYPVRLDRVGEALEWCPC